MWETSYETWIWNEGLRNRFRLSNVDSFQIKKSINKKNPHVLMALLKNGKQEIIRSSNNVDELYRICDEILNCNG